VRAGPAAHRYRARQPRLGQPDQVGGVHIAADQDERRGRGRGDAGPAQAVGRGLGHLADVACALGQVGVGQRGQERGLGLAGLADRGRAVGSGTHRLDRRGDEGRVRRDQRGDVHDPGLLVLAARTQLPGQRGPVPGDRGEGGPHLVLGRGPSVPVY
jgi:hypothetical protein